MKIIYAHKVDVIMRKQKSIGVNAGLNMIKTLWQVIFPLITFPYVSRVLHVENIGIYNFCQSVVSYFSLAAGLGISTYAVREGAKCRNNKNEMSGFASEIFSINVVLTLISYIALSVAVIFISEFNQHAKIIAVLSVGILLTTSGCEWIFQIYEDFEYLTICSIAFQCLSLLLLLLFVKDNDDLLPYAIITVVSNGGVNVVNAFSVKKYCRIRISFNKRMARHLMPVLVLFATSVGTTLYTNADITILGILAGNKATGLYSVAAKIYNIVKQLLAALIIVSIPRLSSYLGQKKSDKFENMANQILNALIVLAVPAVIGIFSLSKNIILLVSGQEYIAAEGSLKILSIALLFSIFSWFYTSCILIPYRMENKVLTVTVLTAVTNVGFNCIFIPLFKQEAAAATMVITDAVSLFVTWWYGRKCFSLRLVKRDLLSVLVGCIGIWMICFFLEKKISSIVISTVVSIVLSIFYYLFALLIMKNQSLKVIIDLLKSKRSGRSH